MGEFACAPVLLIGFNRPERLAAQIARLRALTVWGVLAQRCRVVRALGGWIVPLARWVERRLPCLFRI